MRGLLTNFTALALIAGHFFSFGCNPKGGAVNAEDKEPHYLDGRRQIQQRDFEGAERSFQKALEANPRSSVAHREIGLLFLSHKKDPAAAIYHLQRYLTLMPEAPDKPEIHGHIEALKGDLAKEVLGSPKNQPGRAIQQLRTELNRLAAENQALRHQLQTHGIAPVPLSTNNQTVNLPTNTGNQGTIPLAQNTNSRRHIVKSGQTPTGIARTYNITLKQLYSANPGLNPAKLQIGQELIIPARGQ
jgi:LysM repeat protein